MRLAKLSLVLLLIGLLGACGFKLRGSADLPAHQLPFATIALTLAPTSEFYAQLKRSIEDRRQVPGWSMPARRKPS